MTTVDLDRLAAVQAKPLESGAHSDQNAMCVMEAVAYVAGEPWSDSPQCACPVVSQFLRSWNDSLNDADRNALLKPLIADLVGSKSTEEVEEQRSYLSLDWLIRVFTPKWLDLVPTLHKHANALRGLDAIFNIGSAKTAGAIVRAAWDAAWNAAGAAARDAAWDAARDAAGAAAGDAAWNAAGAAARAAAWDAAWDAARAAARAAAWDAAWDAAGDAARDAAWDAARAAAGAALRPTTEWLQADAVRLVHAMLAVSP